MRWIAVKTLIRRECHVIGRHWLVTLAPPAISTILYFSIFGQVLGEHIGPMDGVRYVEYMTPGLVALSVIPYAFGHSGAGFLGARMFGFVEELLVAPQPRWVLLVGYVGGGVVRGLLVAAIPIAIAMTFLDFGSLSVCLTITALILVALVCALAGFITAAIARSFEQIGLVQGIILFPLVILGGVFVPVSTLPAWAECFSRLNPVFYMVSAIRSGMCGSSEVHAAVSMLALGLLSGALFLIALRLVAGESVTSTRESSRP